ncbi:MAG: AarF/ABC1/UbiB kinase family protein [Verrucomicrobiota bacterium]
MDMVAPAEPSDGQKSIRSTRLGRMAALAGTGAKVGVNYLKYYGKRAVGQDDRAQLDADNASDVYETFSQLKGGPLKLAQMLSIDRNLLPEAYSRQFAQAQYSAPPLSYPLVVRTFQRELGQKPTELFDSFSSTAAHGASIGQVHRARRGDHEYAVKVQYPGVADSLRSDLRVIKPIALQVLGLREKDVASYFAEVEARLTEETDYALELERSQELSAACAHLANVTFPSYHPELSTARILTMDWLDGQPLDRFADSDAPQEQRDRIGQALWDFYDFQIHELRLFHADPHPGNFLALEDGRLGVLDFGCTKQIEPEFYYQQFRFLDPRLAEDAEALQAALHDMAIYLPEDTAATRSLITEVAQQSLVLLAQPFHHEQFDFGEHDFMRAIYEMGENNPRREELRRMRGARGRADSIYVNRAYFGLYSLLTRLRARVRTQLPAWLRQEGEVLPPAPLTA